MSVLYKDLMDSGGVGGKPLKSRTVRRTHATLHRAPRDAVNWGYTIRNAAATAAKPRIPSVGESIQTWSSDEVRTFLHCVRHDRLYAAWHLACSIGMRRGKLLGLRWQDVDLALARAGVRQMLTHASDTVVVGEPKTPKSRGSVALDHNTVPALREWRAGQVVSDRLGRSTVAFPLDVYSHVVPALQEEKSEMFQRA